MRHLLIPALLFAAPAAAQAVSLGEVQAALAATRTMTASFTQTAPNGGVARGTLSLQRPGRIRFDYGPGARTLVVSDGRQLSFVDYEVSQVSRWPVKSTPLGVLLQPDADLSRVARIVPSPVPGTVGVSAQDPKRPDLGRILFFLRPDAAAPGKLALEGWRATDAQGGTTDVRLANPRYNMDLPSERFAFRDPRARLRPPGRSG